MPRSLTETRWVKHGSVEEFVFLGKDVMAMAAGVHVTFFNLSTKEKRIERFKDKERGDGATCLAGHPIVSMFSVAERKGSPKISVFTYPAMHKVSCCVSNDGVNGYLSCAFAGTEYLISLSTFPKFRIVVWLWRTGEKLMEIDTGLEEFDQRISCSPNCPQLLAQFSPIAGKVIFYQMHTCSKIVSIRPIETTPFANKISSLSWTQDGNVFLCDIFCNVWLIMPDTDERYWILRSATIDVPRHKSLVLSYRDGVIVISHDSRVKFYRKPASLEPSSGPWQCVWTSELVSHPTHLIVHPQRDSILFRSRRGVIREVTVQFDNVVHFEVVSDDGFKCTSLCSVPCRSELAVAIDADDRLNVVETCAGGVSARLNLRCHGKVNFVGGHPNLPIVVTCSENGCLVLVNLAQQSSPTILGCFHLCRETLGRVKFSDVGRTIGTLSSDAGQVFIVRTNFFGAEESLVGLMNIERKVVDFLIYEENNEIKVLIIPMANFNACVGNRVIIYKCVFTENGRFDWNIASIIELLSPFETLHYGCRRSVDVLGVPYLSKQLHRFELLENDLRLVEVLKSMHRLRSIGISTNSQKVVTAGYDGLVVVRDGSDVQRIISSFMAHHRSEGGAKCATVHKETIVSLGRNGDLVATKYRHVDLKNIFDDVEHYSGQTILILTDRFDESFAKAQKATWLENVQAAKRRKEEEEARGSRNSIMSDLMQLKTQIKELMDENEQAPDYVRLPISSFDLDHEFRRGKIEAAEAEREAVRKDLESQVARRHEIAEYLRETFWEPMEVHAVDLTSIFGSRKVRNHPLPKVPEEIDDFRLSELYIFDPSDFDSSTETQHSETIGRISDGWDRQDGNTDEASRSDDRRELSLLSGSTAHRWIDDESSRSLHQLDSGGCVSVNQENLSVADRERRLKMHFNDLFQAMRAAKEKEMSLTGRRIERLRQCAAELKSMFMIEPSMESMESPKWRPSEIAENVVRIDDKDIRVPAYTSLSDDCDKTVLIDERREETFVSRSDDFYERALEEFMDGVLEVRWEDDIKKDVPKPECALAKDPTERTEEDLRSIEIYRSRVHDLEAERAKYRSMLENESLETKENLRRSILAFDDRLKAFALTRIQIDTAILQEKLMRLRAARREQSILRKKQELARFVETEFQPASKEARAVCDECSTIEIATSELKNRYETLMKRDKLLETKFRSEFGELKQPMVEHLSRHYKRRPRVGILTCTSVTYLAELGKCVVNNERSEILPRECLDFLRGLDGLDVLPASLPAQIDALHWRTMCKLRRTKIETEMKLRSSAIELAEAESCCSFYQKLSQLTLGRLAHLKNHLELLRRSSDEKTADATDSAEIQLVLKMGQIEVPLQGHTRDFENSIIIEREELIRVNEAIRDAGQKKLAAIQREIDYRQTILREEWRHRCTIMTLDDLKSELKAIRTVKISKDVQDYLQLYPDVPAPEKESERIERNTDAIKRRFRRLIAEEEARLSQTIESIEDWRKRNEKLAREIEAKKSVNLSRLASSTIQAIALAKQEEFENRKLAVIAERTNLVRKIEENYEELLTLHARLEVLKLRTYPTLKFQRAREKRRVQT